MEYYIVKETGAHAFYTIVDENCDLSFFYKKELYLKNEIEISFFINNRKDHESKYVKYPELEKELRTKDIFFVQAIEKDYEIRFSGGELWVFSFSKEKAEKIFNVIDVRN